MLNDFETALQVEKIPTRKRMKKRGTIQINVVESTPVVWEGRLLRFEWVRPSRWGGAGGIVREVGYYHFVDMETEEPVCEFAVDHSFGCCIAVDGKMYVYGVRGSGGGQVLDCFCSENLKDWECKEILSFPSDILLYNTSVCKGEGKYMLAIEIGGSNPAVGEKFTNLFAESTDLFNWRLLDMMEYSYSRDRYTACPCLRYVDGLYYMIYLESAPCHRWIPYIVRTRDFKDWELGLTNPVMWPDDNDKIVIHPERFTQEELDYIENATNSNNSDFDMCDYNGKTIITYSWGNQFGKEFLALAEYDGPSDEFLKSFFA